MLWVKAAAHNPRIPPAECFSTWERFVRNVACVSRIIDMCKKRAKPGRIQADELRAAEELIVNEAQKQLTEQWSAYQD